MLRGTRIIEGKEAAIFTKVVDTLRLATVPFKLKEVIVPAIAERSIFNKVGNENSSMMWNFKDKGDRDVCLVPEVTGLLQEKYRNDGIAQDLFYVSRCYRYERPQKGRYREFTQFGVELLGSSDKLKAERILAFMLSAVLPGLDHDNEVYRGLSYYDGFGFEASAPWLGAQKQVAGGGKYDEGVGFAIGIDRLVLAIMEMET